MVAPPTLLATLEPPAFDGVIESALATRRRRAGASFGRSLKPRAEPLGVIAPRAALGCTPRARPACRRKPAAGSSTSSTSSTALEAVFGASLGTGRVFATVSHRHVYGLLFRILWPLLERRPFATFDCEYPEQLLGAVGGGNVLISSPAMLKRIGHLPERSGQWRAVFSSGGFLPADAAADVARVLGTEAVEVLGSTETSGVAWRTASSARFRLLPSVEVRAAAERAARGALAVRG